MNLGTTAGVASSIAMDQTDYRSLERICSKQAALASSQASRRAFEELAEEYGRKADEQDRKQKKGTGPL